jgi:hypothetical protein
LKRRKRDIIDTVMDGTVLIVIMPRSVQVQCKQAFSFMGSRHHLCVGEFPRSPPVSEDEIQGLFQDFQGPFSVYSRTWQLEKSLKII